MTSARHRHYDGGSHQEAGFQGSQESVATSARRYGVNPETVAKWSAREIVDDLPMRPRERTSSIPTPLEEAATIVAFRMYTRAYANA